MFLLQMAGFPGSGKSTLAKEISKHIDAIVLDRDIIKSSMIESGVDNNIVAEASFTVVFSLAKYYLALNKNVIIDTPCFYEASLNNGIAISNEFEAEYKYIECRVENFALLNGRLKARKKSISQIDHIKEETFLRSLDSSKRPNGTECLIVDSSKPVTSYIDEVIRYLNVSNNSD